MEKYTALVIGATGATGKVLVEQLIKDSDCRLIKVFVRKKLSFENHKLEQIITDFEQLQNRSEDIQGDVLFSALGTTLKQAGSKEAQYKVDFTYQYDFAKIASANGVIQYVLISSSGASANAFMFYPKMKGELEEAVKKLPFKTIHIFQPGMLKRNMDDGRFFEKLAVKVFEGLNNIGMLLSQKPMPVATLAKAMISSIRLKHNKAFYYYKGAAIFEM